ncbi:DZI1L protein, partial [Corythaeola cristata]|nr:DZI1L protein [Corythaeola cristata]
PVPRAAGMPGASPGLATQVDSPPFHFQPRRVALDWRRFIAIDVERVAREVDVAALQEHIASVTFCNLDGEQCLRCGQPADPVLLKVLRMAQLSIEYLLHCQERLGASLATHAQCLEATRAELACSRQQAVEWAAQLRGAKEESRRWKKLMATQQLLLPASSRSLFEVRGRKMYRVLWFSPDGGSAAGSLLPTSLCRGGKMQKMKQVEQMEEEVVELKAKLRETQQQLEAERGAEKLRREQEMERARQREEEGRRDLERWKEEERMKLREEIDGLRQLFLAAFKDMASKSSAMEGKLQELQARVTAECNLGTLRDSDTKEGRWQAPSRAEWWDEQEGRSVQVSTQATSHLLWDWWDPCPQRGEKDPPAPSPGCRPRVAVLVPAPTFTPEREEAALGGKQRLLGALQRNPNLLKQFRPILEEVLEEKLESMGVKRVAKGISTRTYKSLQALVRLQRQQKAEEFPGLLCLRDELVRVVMGKGRRCKKPSSAFPRRLSIIPG